MPGGFDARAAHAGFVAGDDAREDDACQRAIGFASSPFGAGVIVALGAQLLYADLLLSIGQGAAPALGSVGRQQRSKFGQVELGISSTTDHTTPKTDPNFNDTWHVAGGTPYRLEGPWRLNIGIAYDSESVNESPVPSFDGAFELRTRRCRSAPAACSASRPQHAVSV